MAPKPVLVTIAIGLVVLTFGWLSRSQSLAPLAPPATAFDTAQAVSLLDALLKERLPHPVGSDANKRVRDRILDELRKSGYAPEVQATFACGKGRGRTSVRGSCAQLENIVAVLKGRESQDAVLATAHYDSVPAGPGAGDDMAGAVALLALAKHMKSQPQAKNDVIFLISDAEEVGLVGAEAFAQKHALYRSVRVIVNFEARGAAGPSTMFETGPGNDRLIRLFQSVVPRPVADSVAYEVYKLLPNDTDFSVYRRDQLTGFNFAFTGAASRYHSPADNPDLLDPMSLQHHGDHAFALIPALADADLGALQSTGDASYFDVFGTVLVAWPSAWNLPAALFGLALLAAVFWLNRRAFNGVSISWSIVLAVTTPPALFCLGWLLAFPLGVWPGAHPLDHANPLGGTLALGLAMMFAPMTLAWFATMPAQEFRADPRVVAIVAWSLGAAAAVAVARLLPGATHAFLGPVLAFGCVALLESVFRPGRVFVFALAAGCVVASFFWMPYFVALQVVFGFANAESRLAAMAVLGLSMMAAFFAAFRDAQSKLAVFAVGAALTVATVYATLSPPYSVEHPRGTSLIYAQSSNDKPHWVLIGSGPLDPAYLASQNFTPGDGGLSAVGLARGTTSEKPAPLLDLPQPIWIETSRHDEGDTTVVKGQIQAARDGLFIGVAAPEGSGVYSISIGGEAPIERNPNEDRNVFVWALGLRSAPAAVELKTVKGKASHILVVEHSAYPDTDDARALSAARGPLTMPVHTGDASIVIKDVELATQLATAAQVPRP